MEEIKVKYFVDGIDELCYVAGKSDWIDLHAAEDVDMKAGEFRLIPLGVAIELPEGYEAHVVPRSSTFKNYGLLQANSMGVVDYTYRGDNDQWHVPMYATRDVHVDKNTRICQFRIMKNQPPWFSTGWNTSPALPGAASAPPESNPQIHFAFTERLYHVQNRIGLRVPPAAGIAEPHRHHGL